MVSGVRRCSLEHCREDPEPALHQVACKIARELRELGPAGTDIENRHVGGEPDHFPDLDRRSEPAGVEMVQRASSCGVSR